MTFNKRLIAATAFAILVTSANATPVAFTIERHAAPIFDNPYGLNDLSGFGTLKFSTNMINALNLNSVALQAEPEAALQISTSTNTIGRVRYVSVAAAVPLTRLSGTIDGLSVTMQDVETDGGFQMTTIRNGGTRGEGALSISDLKVDMTTKTVYADIVGANGVGTLSDYALWKYDTISGPATFTLDPWGVPRIPPTRTFSGLFLANASDLDNIFVKALNLNNTGRSGFSAVNNRSVVNVNGFGSITISAVPEPSAFALIGVGLVGLVLFDRRRASR